MKASKLIKAEKYLPFINLVKDDLTEDEIAKCLALLEEKRLTEDEILAIGVEFFYNPFSMLIDINLDTMEELIPISGTVIKTKGMIGDFKYTRWINYTRRNVIFGKSSEFGYFVTVYDPPEGFYTKGLTLNVNKRSGFVFFSNEEYDVLLLNGNKLEQFYSSPYEGREGFFKELREQYQEMHPEDQEWLRDIAKSLGESLPRIKD